MQSSQVINSPLCYRTGGSPVDFSECRELIVPPELDLYPDSHLLVYAAKLHPALTGSPKNTVIATYVVNSCNLKDIQEKCDLYYRRFITIRIKP